MNIEITNLYGLICIPFVLVFLWWSIKKQRGLNLKRGIIISRIVLCSLLIGALCGISIRFVGKNAATVFLLDVSDSMRDSREDSTKFIQEALQEMPKYHKASVIVFGGNSQVDKFLDESKIYHKISATPVSTSTNIEQALQKALTYLPESTNKEIILLSDGQENEGDMLKVADLIKSENIDFKVYKVGHEKSSEVYVDQVTVPEKIYKDESFSVVTKVVSNVATKATLTLFAGAEKKSEQEVELEVGENTFVFKDVQKIGGFKSYRAVVSAEADHEMGNNEYSCFTTVQDVPQVLVIEGEKGESIGIENVLKQMGGSYKIVTPESAPNTLEKMMPYKAMVMCNVFEQELPEGFLKNIESYVKSYGGGFIVTGGDSSYALGDYEGTVLENILPVEMHKKGKMNSPTTSLCLVIDHSGSMSDQMGGMTKLGLSLKAAATVVDCLEEQDEISVISFDDQYSEVVPRQAATDKEYVKELIYGIPQGGGTSIYPALKAAYDTQHQSKADIKHIILLTDGEDSFPASQYESLVKQIQSEKITLSTVSVGDGANNSLLTLLANEGGGRNYVADKTTDLPRIFAREFYLSSGEYLVNETFTPQMTNQHQVLEGVMDKTAFNINGYIGTSIKPLATQILTSHKAEPVLALWQYGLGKTVAWTSDVNGEWSGPLFESNKGTQLFKNLLSWSMTTYEGKGNVSITDEGTGVKVTFTTNEVDSNKKVTASYQDLEGKTNQVTLLEVSPGVYESNLPLDKNGFYAFNVTEETEGKSMASYITAFAKQYSKEYKFIEDNGALNQLIEAVDGKLITLPNEAFKMKNKLSYRTINLTNKLLLLAVTWFLGDVIVRRFKLSSREINSLIHKLIGFKLSREAAHINEEEKKESVSSRNKTNPKNKTISKRKDTAIEESPFKEKVSIMNKETKKKKTAKDHNNSVKKKKKEETEHTVLDTAALLKRKKDREI